MVVSSISLSISGTYLLIIINDVNICDSLIIIMVKSSMQATQKNHENREEEKRRYQLKEH